MKKTQWQDYRRKLSGFKIPAACSKAHFSRRPAFTAPGVESQALASLGEVEGLILAQGATCSARTRSPGASFSASQAARSASAPEPERTDLAAHNARDFFHNWRVGQRRRARDREFRAKGSGILENGHEQVAQVLTTRAG
jgi:hypothetical protein